MPAVRYDLAIEQGATKTVVFEWREDDGSDPPAGPLIDTTGYSPHMQIKTKPGGDVLATLGPTQLSNDGNGAITLRLGADLTAGLTRDGAYDLELHNLVDATDVVRLAMGSVRLSKEVTTE